MLSYRARRGLRRLCTVLLVLAMLAAVGLLCWLLWLNRFVIYTKDGVKLDFSLSGDFQNGQLAGTPSTENTIYINYDQTEPTEPPSTELQQLSGYYIPAADLRGDLSAIKEQLSQLPKGTPVMLDVKNIKGLYIGDGKLVSGGMFAEFATKGTVSVDSEYINMRFSDYGDEEIKGYIKLTVGYLNFDEDGGASDGMEDEIEYEYFDIIKKLDDYIMLQNQEVQKEQKIIEIIKKVFGEFDIEV